MSLADAFSERFHPTVRKDAAAPKAAAPKPDDGLEPLRAAAAMAHGKRKAEYEAAIKKAEAKQI